MFEPITEIYKPKLETRASYSTEKINISHEVSVNGEVVVILNCEYTVYLYTDGKVHLYQRKLNRYTTSEFSSSTISYGNIVNTDGSKSYTARDQLNVKRNFITTLVTYGIAFIATFGGYYDYGILEEY